MLSLFFLSLQHRAKRRALLEHGASDIVVASCSRRHPCASCEYSVCSVQRAACSMYSMWAPSVCACALLWFRGGNRIPYTAYRIWYRNPRYLILALCSLNIFMRMSGLAVCTLCSRRVYSRAGLGNLRLSSLAA